MALLASKTYNPFKGFLAKGAITPCHSNVNHVGHKFGLFPFIWLLFQGACRTGGPLLT